MMLENINKCLPHFRMKGKNAEILLELLKNEKIIKKQIGTRHVRKTEL